MGNTCSAQNENNSINFLETEKPKSEDPKLDGIIAEHKKRIMKILENSNEIDFKKYLIKGVAQKPNYGLIYDAEKYYKEKIMMSMLLKKSKKQISLHIIETDNLLLEEEREIRLDLKKTIDTIPKLNEIERYKSLLMNFSVCDSVYKEFFTMQSRCIIVEMERIQPNLLDYFKNFTCPDPEAKLSLILLFLGNNLKELELKSIVLENIGLSDIAFLNGNFVFWRITAFRAKQQLEENESSYNSFMILKILFEEAKDVILEKYPNCVFRELDLIFDTASQHNTNPMLMRIQTSIFDRPINPYANTSINWNKFMKELAYLGKEANFNFQVDHYKDYQYVEDLENYSSIMFSYLKLGETNCFIEMANGFDQFFKSKNSFAKTSELFEFYQKIAGAMVFLKKYSSAQEYFMKATNCFSILGEDIYIKEIELELDKANLIFETALPSDSKKILKSTSILMKNYKGDIKLPESLILKYNIANSILSLNSQTFRTESQILKKTFLHIQQHYDEDSRELLDYKIISGLASLKTIHEEISMEALSQLSKFIQDKLGNEHPLLGEFYMKIGSAILNLDNGIKGFDYLQKAYNILEYNYPLNSPVNIRCSNFLAKAFIKTNQLMKAEEVSLRNINNAKSNSNIPVNDVIMALNHMGIISSLKGLFALSYAYFQVALEKAKLIKKVYAEFGIPPKDDSQLNRVQSRRYSMAAFDFKVATQSINASKISLDQSEISELNIRFDDISFKEAEINIEGSSECLSIFTNLSLVCINLQRSAEAKKYVEKSLEITKITRSESKFDISKDYEIIVCFSNYGFILENEGNFTKAMEFYDHAIQLGERVQSLNSSLIYPLVNKMNLLRKNNEFLKAIQLGEEYLEKISSKLIQNISIAPLLCSLGSLYTITPGNSDQGIQYLLKALSLHEDTGFNNLNELAIIYTNLGSGYFNQNYFNDAENYFSKALDILIKEKGDFNEEVAQLKNNLGTVYLRLKNYMLATDFLYASLEIREKKFGRCSLPVSGVLNNIAQIHIENFEFEEAIELLKESFKIRNMFLRPHDPQVWVVLSNLFNLNASKELDDPSSTYMKQLHKIIQEFGEESFEYGVGVLNTAVMMYGSKNYNRADVWLDRAKLILQNKNGENVRELKKIEEFKKLIREEIQTQNDEI